MRKSITILTPCYNEEENVREVYDRVRAVMASLPDYRYEHLFIDNASTDNTFAILKATASVDTNVKVIRNARNFGHIRSPFYGVLQATGDAVMSIVADLQDPPEMIPQFIELWEQGYPIVIAVKKSSEENAVMFRIRKAYYRLVQRLSGIQTYENFTGFGLYDRKVVEIIREFNDPYPYFRGIIAEIGLPHAEIPFHQRVSKRGITKNNFYTLYDMAMLGITNLSKVPLRAVTFAGFMGSFLCVLTAIAYLVYKLIFWNEFSVGIAPLVIGMFFMGSLQLVFVGIIGEYVGQIHTLVQRRPLVIEQDRINFEHSPGDALQQSPFANTSSQEIHVERSGSS
jgi:glycosyltransferase involved in cell wall biosynthesis